MIEFRCPNCGTPYSPGDAFCGECGRALPPAQAVGTTLTDPSASTGANPQEPVQSTGAAGTQNVVREPVVPPKTQQTQTNPPGPINTAGQTNTGTGGTPAKGGINPLLIGGGVGALVLVLLLVFLVPSIFQTNLTLTPTTAPTRAATAGAATATTLVAPSATTEPLRGDTPTPAGATPTTDLVPSPTVVEPTATIPVVIDTPVPTAAAIDPNAIGRFSIESVPTLRDPQLVSYDIEFAIARLVFEPLLVLNDQQLPAPGSAESWSVSADGLVYTVQLSDNLLFSDGTALTAGDFEYSWKRLFDPQLYDPTTLYTLRSLAYVIAGSQEYAESYNVSDADLATLHDAVGVKALDPTTLTFTLRQPASYFPYLLTLPIGAPVRQSIVEGNDNWTDPATYIGNGPYKLTTWDPSSSTIFEANPNYHRAAPRFARLEMHIIADSNAALAAYRAGEIDWLRVDPATLDTVSVDEQLSADLVRGDGSCSTYVVFNTYRAPFNTIDVRRAFVQAMDRTDWAATRLDGISPAFSLIPPGQPGHQAGLNPLPYSPDDAKKLLASANVPATQTIEVEYVPPNSAGSAVSATSNKQIFDWMKSQLAAHLGVTLRLKPVTQAQYTALFADVNTIPLLSIDGWCQDYPDPQDWLSTLFHSGTGRVVSGWQNNAFDAAVDEADAELDTQKRTELYNRAQTLLAYEAPVLFLEWSKNIWLINPKLAELRDHIDSQDLRIPGFSYIVNITQ